jgi:hypothetical protein
MKVDLRSQSGFSSLSHLRLDIGEGGPIPTIDSSRTSQGGQSWVASLRRLNSKIGIPAPGEGGPVAT